MIELNQMKYVENVKFLTLTFHGKPTLSEANKAFGRFRAWLTYAFPDCSAIWRRECQPRRGSYHYHLLAFNLPYVPQKHLQAMWTRCTREDLSIVDIRRVKNRKHAMKYVSKYVAKLPESVGVTSLELSPYLENAPKRSIGRTWGWINGAALPYDEAYVFYLPDEDDACIVWVAAQEATQHRCGHNPHIVIMFGDDVQRIVAFLLRERENAVIMPPDTGKVCYARWQPA